MDSQLRSPLRRIGYGLFVGLDHLCWLLIQIVPGSRLIGLLRLRPWRRLQLPLSPQGQQSWKLRVCWLLRRRCLRAGRGSSCLSRCLSGRLLLDLIGSHHALHLGMSRSGDGRRVPHAWLSDPEGGRLLTPGLQDGAGVSLTQL